MLRVRERWAALPCELLVAVLGGLSAGELARVAGVCRWWAACSRDNALWRRQCVAAFGTMANLTEGAFAKLHTRHPGALRDWKDWFVFRRMFRREVAGTLHVDFVASCAGGKQRSTQRGRFNPYFQGGFQGDVWSAEFHCEPQPVQKGVKDIVFHFCSYNTVVTAVFYRRSARFAKKVYVGRVCLPLFQLHSLSETLWFELADVPDEECDDAGPLRVLLRCGCVQCALGSRHSFTLRPVQFTVNDFEFVATVSHGSSMLSGSEILFVRDRDTKKPYFLKIISSSPASLAAVSDDELSQGEHAVDYEDTYTIADHADDEPARSGRSDGYALTSRLALPWHPYIVDLFTSFRKGFSHYLLMEWVEGGELFSTVKRSQDGRFAEEHACFYAAEALLALEHLHYYGVVYRDLKPENLLLDRKGHVKLTRPNPPPLRDEGLGHRYNEFLSPEILLGLDVPQSLEAKCDWWSFGCVVYLMLCGAPPFSHPSVNVTTSRIVNAAYHLPPFLSPDARDLLAGLLNRNLKKRLDVRQMKRHAFFAGIDWSKLSRREVKSPVRPFRRWRYYHQNSEAHLNDSCSSESTTTSTTLSDILSRA